MPEEKLLIAERFKVLRRMRAAYRKAPRGKKSQILDYLEEQTELDRKTIIRRLNGSCERKPRRRQRGRTYGPKVDDALRVISETLNYICPRRLTPNLSWIAEHLQQHGELILTPELEGQLSRISTSTVRRILERVYQDTPRLRRSSPQTAHARSQIPISIIPWEERHPGRWEVDLVHHSGPSSSGEYIHTLVMVDVATGWCECAALLGRSYRGMEDAFHRCLQRSPIPIDEVHTDNGSEFFSAHLLRFWKERAHTPHLSRGRPYHSNDNRFVEQRNGALVRAWIGHERLDTTAQTIALNQIYEQLWFYFNLFQPIMRQIGKIREGQRTIRFHDTARTPSERLVETGTITVRQAQLLEALRSTVNPRQLRQVLQTQIIEIFRLPLATEGQTESIFPTLLDDYTKRRWASE
jgi:hypothetical protein